MKTLNKFRIKLESLLCSLKAHECLLCDRPRAVGTHIGHGAVMNETAPPTRSPRPAQDRPGGRSAIPQTPAIPAVFLQLTVKAQSQ